MPKLSPQAKWARRQKRKGRCARCGQRRTRHRQLCDVCQYKFTVYMRAWRAAHKAKLQEVATILGIGE